MSLRLASACVRFASILVPGDRRREWVEEWRGELAALEAERAEGGVGLPSAIGFSLGAIPHGFWMRTEGWTVDGVLQDLKYSARILRRAPGFTAVAVLTLALGIGANASIFSLVNGLVLRDPAGVVEPDQLVQIARSYEEAPRWDNFSWPAMESIALEERVFSGVAGFQDFTFVVGRGSETERISGELVTGNYFEVLGIQPHVGRLLHPADDLEPAAHSVVILSHSLWTTRYGSDPGIVGQTLAIGATPYRILGVAPPGFAGIQSVGTSPRLWVPAMQLAALSGRSPFDSWGSSWINVFGRLQEGVSFASAEAAMPIVSTRLRESNPVNDGMVVVLESGVGLDPEGRREARQISVILLLIVGLVLLITCSNVANLLLTRAAGRRTEVAVRAALGARRMRLIRQMVTESSLLAALATVLAIPLVYGAGRFLPALFPYAVSVSLEADVRVYGFLILTGIVAGFLFGIAPAWAISRRDLTGALREGSSTSGRGKTRLRDALVISQLGLSLGLVAGTALLGRSVRNATTAEPGFQPGGLVAGVISLEPTGRYNEAEGRALYRQLIQDAQRAPGVRAATIANQLPIAGGHSRGSVRRFGAPEDQRFEAEYVVIGPNYFETMGIPLVRGRALGGFDDEPESVVVINEALAALFWPGDEAVGQELEAQGVTWRVVGVVENVQMRSLRSPAQPAVYYPFAHVYGSQMALHLAGSAGVAPPLSLVRSLVAEADPELPVSQVYNLQNAMTASMGETRTIGFLVGAFAALALTLAVVGLYGLVSYGASQRVREIGIRIALGARHRSLVRLILGRAMLIASGGLALGVVISFGLGRVLESLLFGVAPSSLGTIAAAAAILMVAAGIAAWLPARRASRVDAAVSLRDA